MTKPFTREYANPHECPVTATMQVIAGKWKIIIIWAISGGYNRFGMLQRAVPDITKKMLTQQLRELEEDGIISRHVFPVIPPHVEYKITPLGKTLQPIIFAMGEWGNKHALRKSRRSPAKKTAAKRVA